MNVLFANIPFIKHENGVLRTGPNAGSRWPWTEAGITEYAAFPFFMAYATRYLQLHGVDAGLYDGVAERHWDYQSVRNAIAAQQPEILVLETSTPLMPAITEFGQWAKDTLNSRIVLVGPHLQAYAHELIDEPWVDHCVVGEYEIPTLDIALKLDKAKPIYTFEHLENIDRVGDVNFTPFRRLDLIPNYWEPTMNTPKPQLTVSTSRGCPFKCTYCQWPKVMNNGQYRNRDPELVIDEIRTVMRDYEARPDGLAGGLQNARLNLENVRRGRVSVGSGLARTLGTASTIQSILFDDDTWNLGSARIKKLCQGLKDIGMPWTMMGRIDTSSLKLYDLMVDCGCVGMRFGIESFNQRLLDNTKKNLDGRTSYENIRYLLTRFRGLEFHFTTMKNLPGEKDQDWQDDLRILNELKELGTRSGNIVHWQNSDCIAFPGTELWEEMVSLGKGTELRDFRLYDGSPRNDDKLAQAVGWLGPDYEPKWSSYSNLGEPTNLPRT